ncbi:MAG: PIG-L deacetylase family protein [Acidobacteriota bacterium]
MNVLVVAAHPDDEVLGCGGTIARLAQEAHVVHVAILGEGITSRARSREDAPRDEVDALRARAREVGRSLGAASVETFGLPDNRFDELPLLEIVKLLEDLLARHRPAEVFTQHGGDLNIDHQRTFQATLTACRPLPVLPVERLYAYEVPSSTDWAFRRFAPPFTPNTYRDVSSTLQQKLEAMDAYETERRPFPHPRSRRALEATALRWGSVIGVEAAEAFELVWERR